MKKITLFILLISIFFVNLSFAQEQNFKISHSEPLKNKYKRTQFDYLLKDSLGNIINIQKFKTNNPYPKSISTSYHVETFNENLKAINSSKIKLKNVEQPFTKNDSLHFIQLIQQSEYTNPDYYKKPPAFELNLFSSPLNNLTNIKKKNIATIVNKEFNNYFLERKLSKYTDSRVIFSENKKLILVCISSTIKDVRTEDIQKVIQINSDQLESKDNTSKAYKFLLLDDQYNILFDKNVIFTSNIGESFIEDIIIDELNQTIYLQENYYHAELKRLNYRFNENHYLHKINIDNISSLALNQSNLFLNHFSLKIHNDMMICIGMYRKQDNATYNGFYKINIDLKTFRIKDKTPITFTDKFTEDSKLFGRKKKDSLNLQFNSLEKNNFFIDKDGNYTIDFNQYRAVSNSSYSPISGGLIGATISISINGTLSKKSNEIFSPSVMHLYTKLYNSKIIAKISNKGELIWARNIEYTPYESGYNQDKYYIPYFKKNKETKTKEFFLTKIDSLGEMSKKMIFKDIKTSKVKIKNTISFGRNNEEFYFQTKEKKNKILHQIKF